METKESFFLENPMDNSFTINPDIGRVSWDKDLKVGTHTLTIIAQNKAGETKTNLNIIKKAKPIMAPSGFTYSTNQAKVLIHESGSSSIPIILWNGEQGTFILESNTEDKITIDPTNGVISWKPNLMIGIHKIKVVAKNSAGEVSSYFSLTVVGPGISEKDKFKLFQNYPNLTNDETYFVYNLSQNGNVEIDLFNINGQWIENLMKNRFHKKGRHIIKVSLNHLSSGTYIFRLYSKTEGARSIKFMVIK